MHSLRFVPAALVLSASMAAAQPHINQKVPDFSATDSNGQPVRLSDLAGRAVVLEWTNDACPSVKQSYETGAMQALQRYAAAKGAVWLTVVSSAPGEAGYVDGPGANEETRRRGAAPAHVVLDPTGTLGHLYGAATTPQIFVITPGGTLGYAGRPDGADTARAEAYAREAIRDIAAGYKAPLSVTLPGGCSIKYAD